jgi:hypothetical protein
MMNSLEFAIGCLEKEIDSLEGLLQIKYHTLYVLRKERMTENDTIKRDMGIDDRSTTSEDTRHERAE